MTVANSPSSTEAVVTVKGSIALSSHQPDAAASPTLTGDLYSNLFFPQAHATHPLPPANVEHKTRSASTFVSSVSSIFSVLSCASIS